VWPGAVWKFVCVATLTCSYKFYFLLYIAYIMPVIYYRVMPGFIIYTEVYIIAYKVNCTLYALWSNKYRIHFVNKSN